MMTDTGEAEKRSACEDDFKAVLLDIEGTTTPISFVKEVLFPYAKENIRSFLEQNWETDQCKEDVDALRNEASKDKEVEGVVLIPDERKQGEGESETASRHAVINAAVSNVLWQMSADRKTTSLKQVQGHIWKDAYETGKIKGELYDDVVPAFKQWTLDNIKIYIYSSGSVEAQKLLFGYSKFGNVLEYLSGHFDTNIGSKVESNSYRKISDAIQLEPSSILFVTDVVKEAKAACQAGFSTAISVRPGNAALSNSDKKNFWTISTFNELFVDVDTKSDKGTKKFKDLRE